MVHLKSNFNYIHFSKVKIKQELTLGRQLLLWTVVVMDSCCCYGQCLNVAKRSNPILEGLGLNAVDTNFYEEHLFNLVHCCKGENKQK